MPMNHTRRETDDLSGGVSIAVMGIDGAGKTTLSRNIRAALRAEDIEVVDVTWKKLLGEPGSAAGYPLSTVERLGIEGWRLLWATTESGQDAAYNAMPALYAEHGTGAFSPEILPASPTYVRQAGVAVSAMIELAGNYLVQAEVIDQALARGAVVLVDGFGFKSIVKVLRLAQRMPDPSIPAKHLEILADAVTRVYSDGYFQPDIGILLDADPAVTYRWRMAQTSRLGPAEDLTRAGDQGAESFREFQTTLAKEYRDVAREWGWTSLRVDGRPLEETTREAVASVLGDERIRRRCRTTESDGTHRRTP